MYHAVPGVAGVVNYDMDLPVSKIRSFLHELVDVVVVQHIARYGYGATTGLIDLVRYILCLF